MNKYKKISLFIVLLSGQWITMQGSSTLELIKQVAFEASGEKAETLFDIEETDKYANLKSTTIKENTRPCQYIIDARGDGNCGYRAFLGSIFLNKTKFKNEQLISHLQALLDEKYVQFFIKYDQQFTKESRKRAANAIKKYFIEQLNLLDRCQSIQDVHALLNKEYAFNYYMIMFLRYLIIEYINTLNTNRIEFLIRDKGHHVTSAEYKQSSEAKEKSLLHTATEEEAFLADTIMNENKNLDSYKKQILTWRDNLTLDQTRLLSRATNITIYTISESNEYQPLAISKSNQEYGVATILYVPGHYRAFIPKQIEGLATFFEPNPAEIAFEAFQRYIGKSISNSNKLYTLAIASLP